MTYSNNKMFQFFENNISELIISTFDQPDLRTGRVAFRIQNP